MMMNPVDDSFDIEGMTQAALQILCDDPSAEVMYICADDPELKRALFAPDGPVSDAAKQGYESAYLHLFKPLSLFASRVLRDGESLVCMMGQSYLPQVLNDLSMHLRYHWVIAALVDGRQTLLKARRIFAAHKPMLWFVKGSYRGHAIQDVIRSDKYDKTYHDHGQCESEFSEVIKRLTEDGDTVLDCFVGGGTTARFAEGCGSRYGTPRYRYRRSENMPVVCMRRRRNSCFRSHAVEIRRHS
jgi:hypothetical protein